jgi:hypothetical protein
MSFSLQDLHFHALSYSVGLLSVRQTTVHTISSDISGEVELVQYETFLMMFRFTLTFNPQKCVFFRVGNA